MTAVAELRTGPCVNATLDGDGSVLVECPHGGRTPMLESELFGALVRVRGMCEGCIVDDAARAAAERDRELRERWETIIPPRMREWDFRSFPGPRPVRDQAFAWVRTWRDGRNLILTGDVGIGKTSLAVSCLREVLLTQGVEEVGFVNFRDYLDGVRLSFAASQRQDRRIHGLKLLAIDDLGAERPTEWALEELAVLVEHRYGRKLPTIVTSNYSIPALVERLGREERVVAERIVSRLTQDAVVLELSGRDRRL